MLSNKVDLGMPLNENRMCVDINDKMFYGVFDISISSVVDEAVNFALEYANSSDIDAAADGVRELTGALHSSVSSIEDSDGRGDAIKQIGKTDRKIEEIEIRVKRDIRISKSCLEKIGRMTSEMKDVIMTAKHYLEDNDVDDYDIDSFNTKIVHLGNSIDIIASVGSRLEQIKSASDVNLETIREIRSNILPLIKINYLHMILDQKPGESLARLVADSFRNISNIYSAHYGKEYLSSVVVDIKEGGESPKAGQITEGECWCC